MTDSYLTAYFDILEEQPELVDYRTAAYVVSIRQIAGAYDPHLSP